VARLRPNIPSSMDTARSGPGQELYWVTPKA